VQQRIVMPKRDPLPTPQVEDRTVWGRVRKALLGMSKPLFED
jgi:hypothetical protein